MVAILTLTALPWVARNHIRPLISTQDAPSIFERSRIEQMFANKTGGAARSFRIPNWCQCLRSVYRAVK